MDRELDAELHDHDRGLAFDLSTLLNWRRALTLLAGVGLATLAGCRSGFEVYPSLSAATRAENLTATSQLALPEDACKLVYATDGYSQSVRNLAQTSLATDNVFGDGASQQLATVTGDVTTGFTAKLTVPV